MITRPGKKSGLCIGVCGLSVSPSHTLYSRFGLWRVNVVVSGAMTNHILTRECQINSKRQIFVYFLGPC